MLDSPVEEIKSKIDIVDLLSEYIQLKKAGANYKALCPFHNEKTPSFMVSQEKQIWHCFGCAEGGDIFGFVMKMEGMEFVEALRLLAGKAGVALRQQSPGLTSKKNKALDICRWAAKYFHKVLVGSDTGKEARKYLQEERGLTEDTIDDFLVGYAPESWDGLSNFLKKKSFTDEEIFLAGMSVKKENQVGYYDRFRNRIMFPINDVHGNVVGFTGRVMPGTDDSGGAKYINTPQTLIFDKSRILFGLDEAKQEVKKQDLAVIVEGQVDVISSHQAGVKNVVASSGTSLTDSQVALIKRYSKNIAMAFDTDEAGEVAALRGVQIALAGGLNVKIIELPKDEKGKDLFKDPDECIQKDVELWQKAIDHAQPFMDYLFDKTFTKYDIDKIEEKKKATYFILDYIKLIVDKIEQSHYVKKLAGVINETEEMLWEVLPEKKRQYAGAQEQEEKQPAKTSQREDTISDRLLALSLKDSAFLDHVIKNLPSEMMPRSEAKTIYKQLILFYTKESADKVEESVELDYNEIKKNLNEEEVKYLDSLILLGEDAFFEQEYNLLEEELKSLTREAKKIAVNNSLSEIQTKIKQAEENNNTELLEELSAELKSLIEDLNELHQS